MSWNEEFETIASRSESQALAAAMAAAADAAESLEQFDDRAIQIVGEAGAGETVLLFAAEAGRYREIACWPPTGDGSSRPDDSFLADVLDAGKAVVAAPWSAAPLTRDQAVAHILAIRFSESAPIADRSEITQSLAALTHAARNQIQRRLLDASHVERLQTILQISQRWRQSQDLPTLLQDMAEASTQLLGAERASIFLWDKPNKVLVGRPALGVEGGELRIPEDQGVVGDVVRTGKIRRVDEIASEQKAIDRSVDKQLNFETRSLLCVPLRGAAKQLLGAFELINKVRGNFTKQDEIALVELAKHAAAALESTQQYEHLMRSRDQVAEEAAGGMQLIGECPAIDALRSKVQRVARADLSVLILGENGTGKEVVSRMIHYLSSRRGEPFVAVNCAALPESLLESELFGHEQGAFTDARETRIGKFELAGQGTLFLDEIGDMSAGGQAKLLRVLEEKVIVRVGGATPIHTNARVIAATNQDLNQLVRDRKFREDLYFRLNVVTLELPPLRERDGDVLLLADHFLKEFSFQARRSPPKLTAAAQKRLRAHRWPGNIRELRNVMERIVFLTTENKVDVEELALNLSPRSDPTRQVIAEDLPLTAATREFQVDYIQSAIDRAAGNVAAAARELGLHRSNLYRKMRQLGMDVQET